ncbi:MAG: hypothetical protein ACLP8X_10240 [Streptosporangiaceae bacterium]
MTGTSRRRFLQYGVAAGAEGGMWDRPVRMSQLVLTPAERADVIVDFRGLEGRTLIVHNSTPAAPVSTPAPPLPTVMQIRVGTSVTAKGPSGIPGELPGQRADLRRPDATKYITLNEIAAETAGWWLNLNAAHSGKAPEYPRAGTVEDWVFVNTPWTPTRCTPICSPTR